MKRIISIIIILISILVFGIKSQVVIMAAGRIDKGVDTVDTNSNATIPSDGVERYWFGTGGNEPFVYYTHDNGRIYYGTISSDGGPIYGNFETIENEAFYYFALYNESGTTDIHLILNSADGEQILEVGYHTAAGKEITENIKLLPHSKYYDVVYFSNNGTGNYQYSLYYKIDAVGDSKDSAQAIPIDAEIYSSIDGNGDEDYYIFTTGENKQDYKVTLNNISETTNAHILIYSAQDEQLLDVGHSAEVERSHEGIVTLDANSTYYAVVCSNDNEIGGYCFIVSQCARGHSPSDTWVMTKEPTCTDVGEKMKSCAVCNKVLEIEQIEARGHTEKFPETWVTTKEPTCMDVGEKKKYCAVCNELLEIEQIEAKGHTEKFPETWVTTKEPTCTDVGEKKKYCVVCNKAFEIEQIKARGHAVKSPTAWSSLGFGLKGAMCEVCGEIVIKMDWSKVWIIPVIVIGVVILIVGIVNYIKAFRRF